MHKSIRLGRLWSMAETLLLILSLAFLAVGWWERRLDLFVPTFVFVTAYAIMVSLRKRTPRPSLAKRFRETNRMLELQRNKQ